jgi:hypothetical protein
VGTYDESVTVNVEYDDQLIDQAGWRAHLGTWDELRFPRVEAHLESSSYSPTLQDAIAGMDVGDRFTLDGLPGWLPPDPVEELMQGHTERITDDQWHFGFNATPFGPWNALLLDDDDIRADFTGATLNSSMTTTGTSLSLAVASGEPLATTDSGEMPYDINVGGEQMTVTAASGASSPQTLTVTRSVNGVVKAHSSGAEVRLWQPTYAAL